MKLTKGALMGDSDARAIIRDRIDLNLFVEASAGSGKTYSLVERMVSMVLADIDIRTVSAITYTKAAANKFYKDFQSRLRSMIAAETDAGRLAKLQRALEDIDLCFMGTIDAFCSRVLSEHPNKAGIPLGAAVLEDAEQEAALRLEYAELLRGGYGEDARNKANDLIRLVDDPGRVFVKLMKEMLGRRDYELKTVPYVAPDDIQAVCSPLMQDISDLRAFMAKKSSLITTDNAKKKYENYISTAIHPATDPRALSSTGTFIKDRFAEILYDLKALDGIQMNGDIGSLGPTPGVMALFRPNKTAAGWDHTRKFPDKGAYTVELDPEDGETAYTAMWSIKYALAVDLCRSIMDEMAKRFRERGQLSYFSSLFYLRNMLREDAAQGGKLIGHINQRHSYFLVDEFQDTDPIQSQILFYLAAGENAVPEWEKCVPKPGSLFIVGDPKQSIYAFKGSDIHAFNEVRALFDGTAGGFGKVLRLSFNFRSTRKLCKWFDDKFSELMPSEYSSILAGVNDADILDPSDPFMLDGVYRLPAEGIGTEEAANLIMELVDDPHHLIAPDPEKGARRIRYDDFMIITVRRAETADFRKALESCGIPCIVEGSSDFTSSRALCELTKLIAAAADRYDGIALYAFLTGGFFGFTDERLAAAGRSKKAIDAVKKEIAAKGRPDPGRKDNGAVRGLTYYFSAEHPEDYIEDADLLKAAEVLDKIRNDFYSMPVSAVLQKAAEDLNVFGLFGDEGLKFYYFALELMRSKEMNGELTSLKDAAAFMKELLSSPKKYDRSLSFDRTENAVQIANLHKVKGLEKPIVILATVKKAQGVSVDISQLRESGKRICVLFELSEKTNHGMNKYIYTNRFNAKYLDNATAEGYNERRRLNYVAATRAACALFICGEADPKKKSSLPSQEERLKSYWKALAASDAGVYTDSFKYDTIEAAKRKKTFPEPAKTGEQLCDEARKTSVLSGRDEKNRPTCKFVSPHAEHTGTNKLSTSDTPQDTVADTAAPAADTKTDVPDRFGSLMANVKGTLVHSFMEKLVLSKGKAAGRLAALKELVISLKDTGFSEVQKADARALLGSVADTMLAGGFEQQSGTPKDLFAELFAPDTTDIFCELPISYKESGRLVYGIIDLMYVKNGKWHIIDYKTDKDADAAEVKHAAQIEEYRKAVIRLKGIADSDIDAHVYHITAR